MFQAKMISLGLTGNLQVFDAIVKTLVVFRAEIMLASTHTTIATAYKVPNLEDCLEFPRKGAPFLRPLMTPILMLLLLSLLALMTAYCKIMEHSAQVSGG